MHHLLKDRFRRRLLPPQLHRAVLSFQLALVIEATLIVVSVLLRALEINRYERSNIPDHSIDLPDPTK
jgi:hypothetical protein